jgi:plastocyanin
MRAGIGRESHFGWFIIAAVVLSGCAAVAAQEGSVTGRVTVGQTSPPRSSTVVWLTPASPNGRSLPEPTRRAVLRQKNKAFEPHLLVVTQGSSVEFPNDDPWFHNVFSLFNGKRFDLGLYEAGTSRTVHFDREGVSYIFCNIHPEMSAVVVVLSSDYFATADKQGNFSIPNVPSGRYVMHVWSENVEANSLLALSREVQVGDSARTLGVIHVPAPPAISVTHKNKYGQDYEPPSPNNPVYVQQP